MIEDIQEAIKKNLPAEVGKMLQDELALGRAAMLEVKTLTHSLASKDESISVILKEIEVLRAKERKAADLDAFEIVLTKRENSAVITESEYKVEEAEKRAALAKEFVSLVFHSPIYYESKSKSTPIVVPGSNGSQGYVSSATETENKISERK